MAEVTIYENINYEGRSRTFGAGSYRLLDANDMNDLTSSIQVPAGLVAYVYEQADGGGGYGISADFMEDCPDLSQFNMNDKISYITVFESELPTGFIWIRGSMVNGEYLPGHWERKRASGQPQSPVAVVSPPLPPNDHVLLPVMPSLVEISNINGSPWTNPRFDTSDPNWSSNIVGGQTFDGTSAHKFEWVSVLNSDQQQDDEVGLTGIVVGPEESGHDLPFTHPFGPDFEFAIVPDSAYEGLLAPANKDPNGVYKENWREAAADSILIRSGVLGVEVDADLVPPDYRPAQGDRIAVYGRWIVDAGHPEFHTEIHPPLLMARARTVDNNGDTVAPCEDTATLFQLWSRPYQAGQLFSTGGQSGLALKDYATDIMETVRDIQAFPPVFATPFQGKHVVSFTVHPPVPPPTPIPPPGQDVGLLSTVQLECSYHFAVNGSCAVAVMRSPADPNSVLVILDLNSAGYPTLPEPPSQMDKYSIGDLLQLAPGGVDMNVIIKAWLNFKGDVYIRRFAGPAMSQTQDSAGGAGVVPFTPLDSLPGSSAVTDSSQPFPVYGWLKLQWVRRVTTPLTAVFVESQKPAR